MKYLKYLALSFPLFVIAATAGAQAKSEPLSKQLKANIASTLASNGSVFIENKGQWDKHVKFLAHSGNMDVCLDGQGPVVSIHRLGPKDTVVSQTVRFELVNGLKCKAFEAVSQTITKRSYFKGKDPSKWVSNVPSFREIRSNLGKGLSLSYYFDKGRPRYDVIVAPGANPSDFAFRVGGAGSLELQKSGILKIGTKAGTIENKGLFAYQEVNGTRKAVACSMTLENSMVRFRTGAYDHSRALVIDPLIYSSDTEDFLDYTLGASLPNSVVRDSQGYIWTYGYGYQLDEFGYPETTIYVEKLTPDTKIEVDQTQVLANSTRINAITVDASGNPIIVGIGIGDSFPTTSNAYMQNEVGENAFLTQFSSDASKILYSTYLGGSKTDLNTGSQYVNTIDQAYAVAVDSNGNAVVVGNTLSSDFPVTANAFQKTRTPNCQDGFISVLSLTGPTLIASTYFGGAGDANTNPSGGLTSTDALAINSLGSIVIGGFTASKTLPTTVSAYQNTCKGIENAYAAKFSPDLSSLQACTYLGGSGVDLANSLALASDDSVVITGSTQSPDFPYTNGSFNGGAPKQYAAGKYYGAGYLSKLSSDLTTLNWSAFLGPGAPKGLCLDGQNNPVIVGIANNNPAVGSIYPTTPGALQTSYFGSSAAFVSKVSADGSSLLYSTYYGGHKAELGYGIALDNAGNACIRGISESYDLPITPGGYSQVLESFQTVADVIGFFAALDLHPNSFALTVSPNPLIGSLPCTGTVTLPSPAPSGGTTVTLTPNGAYTYGHFNYNLFTSVPSTVTIPAGSTSATFPIGTSTSPIPQYGTITAMINGSGVINEFAINPAFTTALTFNKSSTIGGSTDKITLTATTNGPLAWINNSNVVLLQVTSSNPNVALVSNSPYQPKLQTSFPFSIGTNPVSVPTQVTFTIKNVLIYGYLPSYGLKSISFTVNPDTVGAITVPQATVPPNYYESATISLGQPLSSPVKVSLVSSNPTILPVPSSVQVASPTSFPIKVGSIAVGQKVTITASYGGTSRSVTLTGSATPLPEKLQAASATIQGGSASSAAVYLSGKVAQQTTGTATSSNTNVLTVPASFIIASGGQSGLVKISTVAVTANASVAISATVNGVTVSTSVTVLTPVPSALTVPSEITGGSSTTAQVTISSPAPSQGLWITLKSSNSVVQVPVGVEVLSGQTTASFKVTTSPVNASTTATISAAHGGTTVQTQMTVNP